MTVRLYLVEKTHGFARDVCHCNTQARDSRVRAVALAEILLIFPRVEAEYLNDGETI